jgi:hypothetical protein
MKLILAALLATLLGACGGGGSTTQQAPSSLPPPVSYSGPPPINDEVLRFQISLWANVRNGGVARCAGCHGVSQSPLFARDDNVNLAWEAANPLINSNDPGNSPIVQKMAGGHNCWLGSNQGAVQACATTMQAWVEAWLDGTGTGGTRQIQLVAPPDNEVGQSRNFPADSAGYATNVWPLVRQYCAGCHDSSAATRQSPFFADEDVDSAYLGVKTKIDLDDPDQSRLVLRLREEFHNCWSDCAANATTMENAIRAWAQQIPLTSVDPQLVISKALTMYEGTVASGGSRHEGSQIALWEFKEASGSTAFDTSGVQPAINLSLSGDIQWVGGWGIDIRSGKAQGSTSASRKLHDLITATGQYSIEAWAAPANVNQEDTRIISYSAGPTLRNFTLGQTLYSYDFLHRSSSTDANGAPILQTAAADEDAQATLQHVVLTFDPVNGRRVYVNGVYTQDADPVAGGTLGDWDETFALVLGNEPSGDRQWRGVLRLAAIHNRALTDPGTAELRCRCRRAFLPALQCQHAGRGAPGSYIMFEVSQFDSYSYLFYRPTFINLNADWQPSGSIPVRGLLIGANGIELPVSQAWGNMNESISTANGYTPATGQVLSSLGTTIPLEKGPDADEFFLSFAELGSASNVRVEPAPLTPPAPADGEPQSDIGVKTFEEINATMATITGVAPSTPAVRATWTLVRQQLPAIDDVSAILASHQVGIAQLAIEYCNALVNDTTLRAAVFPGFNFGTPANQAFDTPAERDLIFSPLINRSMGSGLLSQPDAANVRLELDNLTTTLTSCGGSCAADRTATVVKSACAATIGSAATLVQ